MQEVMETMELIKSIIQIFENEINSLKFGDYRVIKQNLDLKKNLFERLWLCDELLAKDFKEPLEKLEKLIIKHQYFLEKNIKIQRKIVICIKNRFSTTNTYSKNLKNKNSVSLKQVGA